MNNIMNDWLHAVTFRHFYNMRSHRDGVCYNKGPNDLFRVLPNLNVIPHAQATTSKPDMPIFRHTVDMSLPCGMIEASSTHCLVPRV